MPNSKTVALAIYSQLEDLHPHDGPLRSALERRGIRVEVLPWDSNAFDWSTAALTVIRSTWDYFVRLPEFLAWVERVPRLWNPAATVRWNSHKSYLVELGAKGIPVVPTELVGRGSRVALQDVLRSLRWDDVVVKPAVSGGSYRTWRVSREEAAGRAEDFRDLVDEGDVMVQPFLTRLHDEGERSLIFFDGELSHGVSRSAGMKTPGVPAEQLAVIQPTPAEVALARRVLAASGRVAHYARVDLARLDDGSECLMELELIEPNLFFHLAPEAAERFAEIIASRV